MPDHRPHRCLFTRRTSCPIRWRKRFRRFWQDLTDQRPSGDPLAPDRKTNIATQPTILNRTAAERIQPTKLAGIYDPRRTFPNSYFLPGSTSKISAHVNDQIQLRLIRFLLPERVDEVIHDLLVPERVTQWHFGVDFVVLAWSIDVWSPLFE